MLFWDGVFFYRWVDGDLRTGQITGAAEHQPKEARGRKGARRKARCYFTALYTQAEDTGLGGSVVAVASAGLT